MAITEKALVKKVEKLIAGYQSILQFERGWVGNVWQYDKKYISAWELVQWSEVDDQSYTEGGQMCLGWLLNNKHDKMCLIYDEQSCDIALGKLAVDLLTCLNLKFKTPSGMRETSKFGKGF